MITGYDLVNSYYEDEKLYSTGDSELDELLERAFCEGYEYAQREFSDDDDDKKKKNKKKKKYKNDTHSGYGRAILIGGPLTSLGAGAALGRHLGKREVEKALEEGVDLKEAKERGEKKAAIVGAIGGGALRGLASAATRGNDGGVILYNTAMGAGRNALGGYLGTKRSNKDWHVVDEDDDD